MRESFSPDPAEDSALPEFTPVPLSRHRRDGWTADRQRAFIARLAVTGVVAGAAKAVGMGVTSAYGLRRRAGAESFARAWDMVETLARERALAFVLDQALNGTTRPRFYHGHYVGQLHRHETRMALAALRALDAAVRAK